ncbi:aminotransferase class IV [Corynebacterium sp. CCM 9185]|uniref:4-amino-4-deoxychorismate lyase n=1 Tax=Corynebacterium marambiense TaxID=2765364 RepID=A0ABS0VWA3_9CORY|nr:aminotransferase class IV [Corynebacterium marambiense]MBI8999900.1 hypothetical protein [Corynebacterium marambiense]MCK7663257.1 aminotransferase class IV [Corynebacterium marambiense]MCX7542355.1 hypothetical protein [Corynebacterium marambiense]
MSDGAQVATSFRMVDGRVRCWGAHMDRLIPFLPDGAESRIRSELRAAGPGAFNPLVSVRSNGVEVLIRPDRELSDRVTVDAVGHRDLRRSPTVKGPDIGWLADRLAESRGRGAGEGLLLDDSCHVVEAVYSAVLVLGRGRATLIRHPRSLESTTAAGISEYLRSAGWTVTDRADITPRELMDSPIWLLNAFSGVRAVSGWITAAGAVAAPEAVTAGPEGLGGAGAWLWENATEI